jgi:two-component system sensor histidine kinase UhpB
MTTFSIRRTIVVGYIVAILIICFFAFYTYFNMQKGREVDSHVEETLQSLKAFENVYEDLQNIETGQRDYIGTRSNQSLHFYQTGLKALRTDTMVLLRLNPPDEKRKRDIARLLVLIRGKVALSEEVIRTADRYGEQDAQKKIQQNVSILSLSTIHSLIERIEQEDRDTLIRYNKRHSDMASNATILFGVMAALFILFVCTFFFLVRRDVRSRLAAELAQQVDQKTVAFKDILDRISDGFLAVDKEWRYVYLNETAAKLTNRKASSLIGLNMWEEYPDDVGSDFHKALQRAMKTQEYVFLESYYAPVDAWFENHIYPSPNGLSVHFRDISEKKNAQAKLKEVNERLDYVSKAANDVLWEADLVKNTMWWNDNFYEKFGYDRKEGLHDTDTSWEKYLHPDDKTRVLNMVNSIIKDPRITTWADEYRFVCANGTYVNIYDRCYILRDEFGKAYKMIGSMTDVSPLFEAKANILRSEEKYRTLVDQATDGIFIADATGRFVMVNSSGCKMCGYKEDELVRMTIFDLADPEDLKENPFRFEEAAMEKGARTERKMRCKDGSVVEVEINAKFLSDGRLLAFVRNIAERKNAERELRGSEETRRLIMDSALDAIICINKEGIITVWSRQAENTFGWTRDEVLGRTLAETIIPPEYREQHNISLNKYNQTGEGPILNKLVEISALHKDGREFPIELRIVPVQQGDTEFFCAFLRDITARKKYEEEIKSAQALADKLIDSLPGVFYFFDQNGKFIRWNRTLETVTGYTSEEVADMHPTGFFHDDEKAYIQDRIIGVFTQGLNDAQANFYTKSGELIPYYFKAALVSYDGKPCLIGNGIDIAERVEAEKQLQQSLTAIRQLTEYIQNIREEERAHIAREIHDELGQQLTVLKMDVSWLTKRIGLEDDEILRDKLKTLTEMLDGTVKTVRRISSELRPSLLDDLGLIAAIDWHLGEFEKRSGVKTEFKDPDNDIAVPDSVKTGLFRIFQESLTNVARHAKAGHVMVTLGQKDNHIVLSIEDDGKGFEKQHSEDKRTLGILGMKERTAMMGGTYIINSIPGQGTTVIVSVPLAN